MPQRRATRKVAPGSVLTPRDLETIHGEHVAVPDRDRLVHLQFRRFAGCPVCNLHLRTVVQRHAEIEAAGVREVVVFHSSADDLRTHAGDVPFAVIADLRKQLYAAFGVDAAPRALLDPRAWAPIVRGVARSLWAMIRTGRPAPSLAPEGGRLGLPADILVGTDGVVVAARYGRHVYDQWSVDELLGIVAAQGVPAGPGR